MKRVFLALIGMFMGFALTTSIISQVPDGFSYQAVVRSNNSELLRNQGVTIKATILRDDVAIFTQTQNATTNENGLLTIVIGNEDFQTIDWTRGKLFIKTEIDPNGGENYTIVTETEMLSVPYAMVAKTAMNVPNLDALNERINNLELQLNELKAYVYGESPENIPFREYNFVGDENYVIQYSICKWKNLNYDNSIIVINSDAEMNNYANCTGPVGYPSIDFSNKTLLLASGPSNHKVHDVVGTFKKFSNTNFKMEVEILLMDTNETTNAEHWEYAILVPKMESESIVELNVVSYNEPINFMEFTKGSQCNWMHVEENFEIYMDGLASHGANIVTINNEDDLHYYLNCDEASYPAIDFASQKLILPYGVEPYINYVEYKILHKLSDGSYIVGVRLIPGFGATVSPWQAPFVISNDNNDVKLSVKFIFDF